jgi:hypothetical protein
VEPEVTSQRGRAVCTALAGLGFVILIIGVTYFGMLVLGVRYGGQEARAIRYIEMGQFLSGGLEWYKDARLYGGVALLCALISLLFGVSPLARITIPVAGAWYVGLVFYGDPLRRLIEEWARRK